MSLSLTKGANVNLSKEAPGGELHNVVIGLGWDPRTTYGKGFDLDAAAIVVDENNQVLSPGHFVYYNQLESSEGAVKHSGDNLTGHGEGDDERITLNLALLPPEAAKIVFPVTIYQAVARGQNFGMVAKAFARAFNPDDGDTELARYDLGEDAATETCVVFVELYRHGTDWKLRAVNQGYADGLDGLARSHGVPA